MNSTAKSLITIGWILFALGCVVILFGYSEQNDLPGGWLAQLQTPAIIAAPLMVSGAVLAAAGHLLYRR